MVLVIGPRGRSDKSRLTCHSRPLRHCVTGRHWWGLADADVADMVDPATGSRAIRLRKALGLPDRGADATGATLVVLDPDLEDLPLEAVAAEIQEGLLWYL